MTAAARKIAALEAKAASTTFAAERETCLRLAAKLREKLAGAGRPHTVRAAAPAESVSAEICPLLAAWAELVLGAVAGFGGREDHWAVPGHVGPPVDYRQLITIALERGFRPGQELQAEIVRAMGWHA